MYGKRPDSAAESPRLSHTSFELLGGVTCGEEGVKRTEVNEGTETSSVPRGVGQSCRQDENAE